MDGFIYMLRNEAMPDLYKIGMTERNDVEGRRKDLSGATGVPLPFEVEFAYKINCSNFSNIREFESWLHSTLGDKRVNPKREFFRVNPEMVRKMIAPFVEKEEVIVDEEIDAGEEVSIAKYRKIRPFFNFAMVGIKVGDTISYIRDSNIKAVVIDNKKIRLLNENGEPEGEAGGISSQIIFDGIGERLSSDKYTKSGRYYTDSETWEYNGETLWDIRMRKETEEAD